MKNKIKFNKNFQNALVDFFSIKKIIFILPLVLIFSSLKAYGYVFAFVFYLPYLYLTRKDIFFSIKNSTYIQKLVLLYLFFLLIEIIYGSFFIKDFRIMIFWAPFIFSLAGIYFLNIHQLRSNKFYKKNYLNILFTASNYYFIFYFLMNIFFFIYGDGFYSLQDNLWIGSSGAFAVSSVLFYSCYKLWERVNFKLFSKYTFVLLFYIFLINLNESRFGLIYLLTFLIFIILRSFQLNNFKNIIIMPLLVLSFYSLCTFSLGEFHNYLWIDGQRNYWVEGHKSRTIIRDTKTIFNHEDDRLSEFLKGIKKFEDYSLKNKFIGTGWYSSRITINLDQNEIIDPKLSYIDKKVTYLQAIVAILLDTGLFGIIFSSFLATINLIYIFNSRDVLINRLFFSSIFLVNLGSLFLGYPLVNLAFVLFILPDGIIHLSNKFD